MTTIRLTNSATRGKEDFTPSDPENVRMYVCGPTVYDRAHMGNARSAVVFDTLFRLLREVYGASSVTYVRNVTDVDDKINARAAEMGRDIADITAETLGWYVEDMAALGCMPPTESPRATAYIPQMIAMIERLVAEDHAYAAEGHVLFSVSSFDGYGDLSGRSLHDMIAGARVEVAPYKRNPMDFVLWKPAEPGAPGWDSPWGRGRPGWHIECSAMAEALLGESFDIHGGGGDLMFPHHENEIAQSACAHGGARMARYWLHNEMLQVEGRKMSKSLGNFFTVRDKLDEGVPGEVMRFVMLGTHYRSPMDWTEKKVREAEATLKKWFLMLDECDINNEWVQVQRDLGKWRPSPGVVDALSDDLNTPLAITRLHELAKTGRADQVSEFAASIELLGLIEDWNVLPAMAGLGGLSEGRHDLATKALVDDLLWRRQKARARRDYATADAIRDKLVEAGVEVRDLQGVPSWKAGPDFDSAKLEKLR